MGWRSRTARGQAATRRRHPRRPTGRGAQWTAERSVRTEDLPRSAQGADDRGTARRSRAQVNASSVAVAPPFHVYDAAARGGVARLLPLLARARGPERIKPSVAALALGGETR
eukprot:5273710-Pyramimonas_sp.AAC.1